ncbi:hypothetical protein KKA00_06250 [bacterium]|nr:hypothetical protein [bacterium]MBU1880889.1 hypothetical protein [bacterium]
MKKNAINLLLLFVSLGLALVGAELIARGYLAYQDKTLREKRRDNILTQVSKQDLFTPINPGSFAHKPDEKVHWWGFDIRIDSLGNRQGIPATSPNLKILFLGDSMIFGLGLADHHTIPSLLQTELESTQVINAGVIGYDMQQYLYHLRRLTPYIKPDLVVIGICYNDLFPNEDPFRTVMADRGLADEELRARRGETTPLSGSPVRAVKRMLRETTLYLLYQQSHIKEKLKDPRPREYSQKPMLVGKEKAPQLIGEFLDSLDSLDLEAAFVYFPTPDEIGMKSNFVYVEELEKRNQPVLDLGLTDRITKESYFLREKGKYMLPDIHFNLEGSKVVAHEIAEWLKDEKLVN